jgi:hypothetical protein
VKRNVIKSNRDLNSSEFIRNKDYILNTLIPCEIKITKSKEGKRDVLRYVLFCQENLRIYNSLEEFIKEIPAVQLSKNKLSNDINALTYYTVSTLSEDVSNIQINFNEDLPMILDI